MWIGTKANKSKVWTFYDDSEIGFWDFGGKGYCKKNCKPEDNKPVYNSSKRCAITYAWPPLKGAVKMWTQRCNTKAFYLCEGPKDTLEYELLGIVDPGQSVKQQTKEDLIPLAFDAAKSSCVARGGQLAQIRNHAEFGKVESLLGSYNLTGSAYFGASDITKEGSWITVDGFSM